MTDDKQERRDDPAEQPEPASPVPPFLDRDDDSERRFADADHPDDLVDADLDLDALAPDPGYMAFATDLDDPLADWPSPESRLEDLPELRAARGAYGEPAPLSGQESLSEGLAYEEHDSDDYHDHDHDHDHNHDPNPTPVADLDIDPDPDPAPELFLDDDATLVGPDVVDPDTWLPEDSGADGDDFAAQSNEDVQSAFRERLRGDSEAVEERPGEEHGKDSAEEHSATPRDLNDIVDDTPIVSSPAADPLDDFLRDLDEVAAPAMTLAGRRAVPPRASVPGDTGAATTDRRQTSFPVAIAVALLLGLGLLAAAAWYAVQERSALQAEIRELQARLATRVEAPPARPGPPQGSPRPAERAGVAADAAEQRLRQLEAEKARLAEQLRSSESALAALQERLVEATATEEDLRERLASRSADVDVDADTATATLAGSTATGASSWFVNFGSFSEAGVAERWAEEIRVDAGSVIVQETRANGRSLFRVRVVALDSQARAETIARALEQEYELTRLWVGRTP